MLQTGDREVTRTTDRRAQSCIRKNRARKRFRIQIAAQQLRCQARDPARIEWAIRTDYGIVDQLAALAPTFPGLLQPRRAVALESAQQISHLCAVSSQRLQRHYTATDHRGSTRKRRELSKNLVISGCLAQGIIGTKE